MLSLNFWDQETGETLYSTHGGFQLAGKYSKPSLSDSKVLDPLFSLYHSLNTPVLILRPGVWLVRFVCCGVCCCFREIEGFHSKLDIQSLFGFLSSPYISSLSLDFLSAWHFISDHRLAVGSHAFHTSSLLNSKIVIKI